MTYGGEDVILAAHLQNLDELEADIEQQRRFIAKGWEEVARRGADAEWLAGGLRIAERWVSILARELQAARSALGEKER